MPEEVPQPDKAALDALIEQQLSYADRRIDLQWSDAELLATLQHARLHVEAFLRKTSEGTEFSYDDIRGRNVLVPVSSQYHAMEVGLQLQAVLMIAEMAKKMLEECLRKFSDKDSERDTLMLSGFSTLSDFDQDIAGLLAGRNHATDVPRLRSFIHAAARIEAEANTPQFIEKAPADLDQLNIPNGSTSMEMVEVLAGDLAEKMARLLAERFIVLMEKKEIAKDMIGWEKWISRIEQAAPCDAVGICEVYRDVTIQSKQLEALHPARHAPAEQAEAVNLLEDIGGFLRLCKPEIVRDCIRYGDVSVVRDDKEEGRIAAFYSTLHESEIVKRYMREFGFDPDHSGYQTKEDLPVTFTAEDGRTRTIHWVPSRMDMALETFKAAQEGALVYSVDMAVRRMEELPETVRRNAQLATACKLNNYHRAGKEGKKYVIMEVFEIVAIGNASDPDDKLIPLPDPPLNVKSYRLNQTIGAREICTMEEIIIRRGIKMRVVWHVLVNPIERAERLWQKKMGEEGEPEEASENAA